LREHTEWSEEGRYTTVNFHYHPRGRSKHDRPSKRYKWILKRLKG